MSGPTRQPSLGASVTIAADTGPGDITAPNETAKAKAKTETKLLTPTLNPFSTVRLIIVIQQVVRWK